MFAQQRTIWVSIALSILFALSIATGCGPGPEPTPTVTPTSAPVVLAMDVNPNVKEIEAGETVAIVTTVSTGEAASLTWSVEGTSGGELSSKTGDAVFYTAGNPGVDIVTAEGATAKGAHVEGRVSFNVIAAPTATPVPPTDIPVPLTDTPTPTQSMPTDTPAPTFTPVPSVIIVGSEVYCTENGGGGTETIPVEPPRTVARIRIDMKKRATEHGDSLWEVEAYGPDTGDTNLVISGQADASSAQDSFGCEGCFADKAIDGDMNTRWSSDWSDPQWLEITLPGVQVVNRIVLKWEAAYAKEYCVTVAERVIPTPTPPPADTPTPIPSACPSADAEGTVPPAVAISSITFIVNGVEQVVRDADALQASSGDQVQVREVTICPVDPFGGDGGVVYVEFDPVDQDGQVIASEVKGTRAAQVTPGFTIIQGSDYTWTIGGNWRHISVVTVHYPPGGGTQNPGCEGGLCEVDDRMIVGIE